MSDKQLPLAGVKVLDFAWALVGSLTTKMLADHGAEVVKVESSLRPCLSRIDNQVSVSKPGNFDDKPWFSHFNSSKLSLRLNMKHERVNEIIDPLLDWADVVVENFSPGTMEKLGLDYESIRQGHPDIIMVSGSVFGQTGPYAKNWGVDGTGAALSSRIYMTGWPDRDPVTPSVPYGDVVLPYFMAAAVSAAVDYKRRTGKGQYIDAAMYEVCAQQMSEALVDSQLQKEEPKRSGNHSPDTLFQGVFPCRSQNPTNKIESDSSKNNSVSNFRWIGISISTKQEWETFLHCLPGNDWPSIKTVKKYSQQEMQALEDRVANWSISEEDYPLMHKLQQLGIAAGVVQDIADTYEKDPQLQHREYLTELEHPYLGKFGHQTPPFSLSRTPAQVKLAPNLGQHSEYVCKDILGFSDQQFQNFVDEKLFV